MRGRTPEGRSPRRLPVVLLLLFSTGLALGHPGPSGYHLLRRIPLDGEEGWDYLEADSAGRRLYLSRENRVTVLDLESEKIVGEVRGLSGVHGIAVAPEFGRGFCTNGRDGTCAAFDLKTLKPVAQIKTGKGPDAIVYDPASKRVFACNGGGESITAIEAGTGAVAGTVGLGGVPESAAADGTGRVYVNLEDKHQVLVLDSRKLAILGRWSLGTGQKPTGLAIDRKNRRLFSTCRDSRTLVILDADSGRIHSSLPIGAGVDAAAFDPETHLALCSNGDATLTVVREDSPAQFTFVENLQTWSGAKTMALDLRTHRLYLLAADQSKGTKEVALLIYGLP